MSFSQALNVKGEGNFFLLYIFLAPGTDLLEHLSSTRACRPDPGKLAAPAKGENPD